MEHNSESPPEKPNLEKKWSSNRDVASHLGISDERVLQLHEEGVVVKYGRNQYDLLESSKNYIRYLQARSNSTVAIDGDYNHSRAESEKYKALIAEKTLAEKEGQMATKIEVQQAIGHAVVAMRRIFESAPGKLKTKFPDLTNDQIEEITKYLVKTQNAVARIDF